MRNLLYLVLGLLLLAFGVHDLAKGKLSLSFGNYDRSERPVAFFLWVIFAAVCGIVLVISAFH